MSTDNTSNSGEGSDDSKTTASPDGPNGEGQNVISRSEFEAVRKARDDLKKELRELRDQLNADQTNKQRDDATKKGDVEGVRKTYESEVQALRDQLREKDNLLYQTLCEREVRNILRDVTTDDDLSWMLLKDHFELDGDQKPRVKDSLLSIREFVVRELENRGKKLLLKNDRKGGFSTEKGSTSKQTEGATEVPTELPTWSKEDQRAWFTKNPEAARKFGATLKLGR